MISKSYSKTGQVCRVTFRLPAEVEAESISVLGDFNEWEPEAHPLKARKNGTFSTTVSLASGQAYRFRYLADGQHWLNDDAADEYALNRFGEHDSVVGV